MVPLAMNRGDFRDAIARSPCIFAIGVAGDSGSGKTTFTGAIREIFGEELVSSISLDDYHRYDREERKALGITPLAPEANRIDGIEQDLGALKRGEAIEKPVYNHRTGAFDSPVPFAPKKILILEGLHTLFTARLRGLLDFTLFVDPDEEEKRFWKMKRDTGDRGYRSDEVEEERAGRAADYRVYIRPQRQLPMPSSLRGSQGTGRISGARGTCTRSPCSRPGRRRGSGTSSSPSTSPTSSPSRTATSSWSSGSRSSTGGRWGPSPLTASSPMP